MISKEILVQGNIYIAGVYAIGTKEGKVLYIGSSIECNDALSRHLYNLKRNYYADSNKRPLQEAYDREDLVFKIIHESAHADEVRNMTLQQKEDLQKALGVLEEFHIGLNNTVCNKMRKIAKWSTSPTPETTLKRKKANTGSKNPNVKYDEELVANIMFLKEKGFKPREIVEMLLEHDIEVHNNYISQIGVYKWIHLESKKPEWYSESEVV